MYAPQLAQMNTENTQNKIICQRIVDFIKNNFGAIRHKTEYGTKIIIRIPKKFTIRRLSINSTIYDEKAQLFFALFKINSAVRVLSARARPTACGFEKSR
jgi:hypothetical protein